MTRPKKKHKYTLDEVDLYMTKKELGVEPTLREVDTIGEFVDELKGEMNEEIEEC